MATSWKSQQGNGEYSLQFETDSKEKYKLVEKAAQMAVDGKTVDDVVEVKHGEWKDRYNIYEIEADHLLANGVIAPPCKVGDTVYQTDGVRVYESTVKTVLFVTDGIAFDESAIGSSVFLKREEAALKGGVL
ncbi:MAG: hypothetical protein IKU60_03840 [Clostridia bacterium]|nr:hypothetical protein [Clostridia bacterium]